MVYTEQARPSAALVLCINVLYRMFVYVVGVISHMGYTKPLHLFKRCDIIAPIRLASQNYCLARRVVHLLLVSFLYLIKSNITSHQKVELVDTTSTKTYGRYI